MSSDDDPELRDLIARCLENNGVLGKIRAQLRASTFLALEQQDDSKVTFPINNASVRQFATTDEGALALSLVRELLSFFNMQFTLSVFDPESCESVAYQHTTRTALASQFGLDSVKPDEPILQSLISKLLKKSTVSAEEFGEQKRAPEKTNNIPKVNGDDYDEDFNSSSSASTPRQEIKEKEANANNNQASIEEDLDDLSTSDLLASHGSNADNETVDRSTSNSSLANADYVETLPSLVKP